MSDYSSEIPIHGDGRKLLERARDLFALEGYEVSPIATDRFEATGGHPLQNNSSPIHGVSRAVFLVSPGTLTVEAELGGVRKLRNFLLIFLPGLGLILAIVFSFAGMFADKPPYMPFVAAFAPLSPWVILVPILTYLYRRRTRRAIETLLKNLQSTTGP